MKQKFLESLSILVIMIGGLCPLTTSAQTMTLEKAKKAGIIVLADKEWVPLSATGHMIYLRLRDKARPKHKKNEILIHEIDCRTQKQDIYKVTLEKGKFEMSSEWIEMSRLTTPLKERDFSISKEDKGLFFCSSKNVTEDFRQYEIKLVLFYKNLEDIFAGSALGEVYDLDRAFFFMSEMFKPYLK